MKLQIKKIILWLLSYLTRWLWRLVVLVVILVAVIVSVGRELAPLLHEHKIWLEANLTASTGELVTIREVNAYWEGLVPELVVKGLAIGDSLQIDNAMMRVDLLGSAKTLSLVFDTLDITHASVVIPVGMSATEETFDYQAYLDFLFGSSDIRVHDLEVTLQHGSESKLPLQIHEFIVQNNEKSHWLNAAISIGAQNNVDNKTPAQLIIKFDGDADNIFLGTGRAYVDLGDEKNLSLLENFVHRVSTKRLFSYIHAMEHVNGQLWASWQNQRINWVAETAIKNLIFSAQEITDSSEHKKRSTKNEYSIDFSGKLAGYLLMEEMFGKEYFLHVSPEQDIFINRQRYLLPESGLRYIPGNFTEHNGLFVNNAVNDEGLKIYLPDFALGNITQYQDLLPSPEWRRVLQKLKPSGSLKRVVVSLPLQQQAKGPLIQANLDKVSVSDWQGAPTLGRVDGYLEASSDAGFIELDSQQGFSMHYKTLYRQPMQYNRARGRIDWNVQPDDKHIYVGSQDLDFHNNDDGDLAGTFWLDIPPVHTGQSAELYLTASLTNTQVKYRNKYLPYILNASLKEWLANSIKEGDISESSFIYRGSLSVDQALDHTLQYLSKVKNGRLQFDAAWPVLSDMDALTLVDNEEVHTVVKKAHFLGFTLNNARADLALSVNNQAHFLSLQADIAGPANDALTVLRDTPLRKTFGDTFDGWKLSGDAKGHLNLGMPVGEAQEPDFQEIDIDLGGNDLWVGGINLPLENLKGQVHYSSKAGLSSNEMTARLWGQNQSITINPDVDDDGPPDMVVSMTGNIDPQSAAVWAHLPFVHFLQGLIPVQGTLTVPLDLSHQEGPIGTVVINTDMQGVVIDLPPPFKKLADEKISSSINVDLWKDRQAYRVEYGHLMSAIVSQSKTGLLKGDIAINQHDTAAVDLPDYLRLRANLEKASLSEWLPVMARNTAFTKADENQYKKDNPEQPGVADASVYPVFDLFIKQLSIGSMKLDDIKLLANYQKDSSAGNYWNIAFQNAMMAGRYHSFDDTRHLPEVDFDTVRLGDTDKTSAQNPATEEEDSKRIDPLADVIPQDLPAMRVHAKQVILQGDDVGDWRYVLTPDKKGVTLENLFVAMPGLAIKGIEEGQGATVHWYREGNKISTDVRSRINLSNQDGVKKLFGVERIIEAEKTDIQGEVSWNGSPAMLSFRRLQGDLSFTSEKGRFLNSTASTDVMRVINVFNFSTWARRLKLDFTDLYKKGVSFDKVSANVNLEQGKVTFDNPLKMDGPSGRFELTGVLDSVQNTIDASLIVTIPVNQNATWIAALAAGLPVAAGVWAVSKIFGDQIDKLSSVSYTISGSLDDPKVKFVSLLPELQKNGSPKSNKTEAPAAPN